MQTEPTKTDFRSKYQRKLKIKRNLTEIFSYETNCLNCLAVLFLTAFMFFSHEFHFVFTNKTNQYYQLIKHTTVDLDHT